MDDWLDDMGETYGVEVWVTDHETHSPLLGPDGQPLEYEPVKLGFDLTPKSKQGQ